MFQNTHTLRQHLYFFKEANVAAPISASASSQANLVHASGIWQEGVAVMYKCIFHVTAQAGPGLAPNIKLDWLVQLATSPKLTMLLELISLRLDHTMGWSSKMTARYQILPLLHRSWVGTL